MRSDYMHWAKFKAPVRFALTGSEVPHFRMDSLSKVRPGLEIPMTATKGPLYEYACHEGNRDVEMLLRGGLDARTPGPEAAAAG